VLGLRASGLSFAAIATRLGLKRSKDAFEAFHRALNSSAEADKPELIKQEMERLSALEDRIRSRDSTAPAKMEHRLQALEQMRLRLNRSRADG
jgi:hypothetical protein